nr:MAG TPA: hypothetical protein [Caudoviricetes sp.]
MPSTAARRCVAAGRVSHAGASSQPLDLSGETSME